MRRLAFALFCILLSVNMLSAQENIVVREILGGYDVTIRAAASRSDDINAVRDAAIAALPVYDRIWVNEAQKFPILLDITETPSSGGIDAETVFGDVMMPDVAGVSTSQGNTCETDIYLPAARKSAAELQFDVAHELSHCFQRHAGLNLNTDEYAVNQWYIEGSADWMASLVYPLSVNAVHVNSIRSTFVANSGQSVFDGARNYDSVYLWTFIAQRLSDSAAVALLKVLTPDKAAQIESFALDFPDTTGFLFQLAGKMVRGEFADSVPVGELFVVNAGITAPITFNVNPYGVAFNTYHICCSAPEGIGIRITPANLSASNTRAALADGTELLDSVQQEICEPPAGYIGVYAGRGESDQPAAVLDFEEYECDPSDVTAVSVMLPDCMLGDWYYFRLPVPDLFIRSGYQRLTIYQGGVAILETRKWELGSRAPGGGNSLTTFIDGVFRITAYDESSGATEAETISLHYGEMVISIGGEEVRRFGLGDFGTAGLSLPNTIRCLADEDVPTLEAIVAQGGIEAKFGLRR